MPRVDLGLWDRVYILKLICTAQMTFSSFIAILYLYLIGFQSWSFCSDDRPEIMSYKWGVLVVCAVDFAMGTLLAYAANKKGIPCKRRMVVWIIVECFLVPAGIFLVMRLLYKIKSAKLSLVTDQHFTRINIAQAFAITCQLFFIIYVIDFLVIKTTKKTYDPSIRPAVTYETTDPEITTTESRHIRLSQSLLFQPSTSKGMRSIMSKEESRKQTKEDIAEEQIKKEMLEEIEEREESNIDSRESKEDERGKNKKTDEKNKINETE